MAEPVELPSRLAILPFRNKVLLPGAIIRIRCTSPSSVKLVEQELWQREEKGLIGVLPVRDVETASSGDQGPNTSPATPESHKHENKNQHDPIHWHNRGVAARALHLSRGVEKPSGRVTYIVVLEGLCRFSVQELSARGTYYIARISRLDMNKSELEHAEQDPDFIALSRQFKATSMELISVLEQRSSWLPSLSESFSGCDHALLISLHVLHISQSTLAIHPHHTYPGKNQSIGRERYNQERDVEKEQ